MTADEIADGFFTPETTWEVTAAGQTAVVLEVHGGEVDLLVRDPGLSGSLSPAWEDVDGDGFASIGDTVTYTAALENTGNVTLTQVTAPGLGASTLVVGETVEFAAEVVVLAEDDLAAGTLAARSVEATGANGSRTASTTLETGPFPLEVEADHPAWDATTVYLEGDRVTHNGAVFEALWWTRGEVPGSSPWGAWQEIVTDADGTSVWTPSRVFVAGDVVRHNGADFVAKWWTRNQAPGDPYGPWQPLG